MTTAVVIIDHGSRRDESNELLEEVARDYESRGPYPIVEAAHMELAEPDLAAAFRRCVERGAERVIVQPFFLFPGRHWAHDIPALASAAAASFPQVPYLVTAPLAPHALMLDILHLRAQACLERAAGAEIECRFCQNDGTCRWRNGSGEGMQEATE